MILKLLRVVKARKRESGWSAQAHSVAQASSRADFSKSRHRIVMGGMKSMRAQELQCVGGACLCKYMRVRLGARERNRVVGQAAQDGTGQQLRSGKMAGTRETRLHNVMVGACHAARARCDAPATPDCLMTRMVPVKP